MDDEEIAGAKNTLLWLWAVLALALASRQKLAELLAGARYMTLALAFAADRESDRHCGLLLL